MKNEGFDANSTNSHEFFLRWWGAHSVRAGRANLKALLVRRRRVRRSEPDWRHALLGLGKSHDHAPMNTDQKRL